MVAAVAIRPSNAYAQTAALSCIRFSSVAKRYGVKYEVDGWATSVRLNAGRPVIVSMYPDRREIITSSARCTGMCTNDATGRAAAGSVSTVRPKMSGHWPKAAVNQAKIIAAAVATNL